MPSPPIQIFLTTIVSQPTLRQRQETLLRILQVKKIPYTSYDLASDESAKKLWRRKAPLDKQQLPGILVGGRFPGFISNSEDAMEYGELDIFFRLKETWVEDEDHPQLPSTPIGVPGATPPPKLNVKPSPNPSPSPLKDKGKKGGKELDLGIELDDAGLEGVTVTDEELADLVKELGLEGDEAGDLVKGLSGAEFFGDEKEKEATLDEPKPTAAAEKGETELKAEEDKKDPKS
ncbi:hypothetical protein SCHPADRAFT_815610, partial [Schizopora paradoxa]